MLIIRPYLATGKPRMHNTAAKRTTAMATRWIAYKQSGGLFYIILNHHDH